MPPNWLNGGWEFLHSKDISRSAKADGGQPKRFSELEHSMVVFTRYSRRTSGTYMDDLSGGVLLNTNRKGPGKLESGK